MSGEFNPTPFENPAHEAEAPQMTNKVQPPTSVILNEVKDPCISPESPQNCHPERSAAEPKDLHFVAPPNPHQRPFALRWLTYLVFIPLMSLSTIFFGCISLLCGLWDTSGRQQHTIASIWGKSLLAITLSPVTIIGNKELLQHPSAVYASNHLSYMDTPALFAKLPFQFRIFAKSSLWKIPFIGWYLNRSGQVPIDQKSPRTAIAGLLRGVATVKSGLSLVLFPEGGRAADGNLQSMMSGCAFMAIRAGVPLIPIALIGTYELLPIHTYHLSPRPLKLIVGAPLSTEGLTTRDADALTTRLYEAISALYLQHS
jgi:1-acyl-sn-glycerol-3-phosphate acyltransferase